MTKVVSCIAADRWTAGAHILAGIIMELGKLDDNGSFVPPSLVADAQAAPHRRQHASVRFVFKGNSSIRVMNAARRALDPAGRGKHAVGHIGMTRYDENARRLATNKRTLRSYADLKPSCAA